MSEPGKFLEVPMHLIEEPSHQVREKITEEGLEELQNSIGKRGLLQAITLMKKGSGYMIVYGHRRFLAVKNLGWSKIPAIVKEIEEKEVTLDAIHENLHREDMSPIEEGRAIKRLLGEGGESKKDVARMCSKSESWVDSRVALLEMPVALQEAVDVGALSVSAARELAGITDDDARAYYTEYAIKQGATAQLCAFWRGKWLMERTVNDPSAMGDGAMLLTGPCMEVKLPCFWCEKMIDIKLIDHLRVCPKCREALYRGRMIIEQESLEGP